MPKEGSPRILKKCTLPLTARGKVNMIVTEKAVISVSEEGLVLNEIQPGCTLEEILNCTDAELMIPAHLSESVA